MIKIIEEKQLKLKEIGDILKSKYRGIDRVIDEIMEKIEVWYVYNEILYKPVIVNLYGMTGCGKTGLVKDLAKLLGMYEKFCEIDVKRSQEAIDGAYGGSRRMYGGDSSVAGKIFNIVNDTSEQAIVLIDEFQNIKATNGRYNDVWNLLSDGRLGNGITILSRYESAIRELQFIFEDYDTNLREINYIMNDPASGKFMGKGGNSPIPEFGGDPLSSGKQWNPYTMPIPFNRRYMIERIADLIKVQNFDEFTPLFDYIEYGNLEGKQFPFGFREYCRGMIMSGQGSLEDIFKIPGLIYVQSLLNMVLNSQKKIIGKFNDATGRDPLVFSKLLIFIAGNVDGLYADSSNTTISADALHEKTLKLTVANLKDELMKVFAPEEVGRLGGNFIIYPSLDKESFTNIINDNLKLIEDDTFKTSGIKVKLINEKFINYLYDESVVASLGARPMISKVQGLVNVVLPKLIKTAVIGEMKEISVTTLKGKFK